MTSPSMWRSLADLLDGARSLLIDADTDRLTADTRDEIAAGITALRDLVGACRDAETEVRDQLDARNAKQRERDLDNRPDFERTVP